MTSAAAETQVDTGAVRHYLLGLQERLIAEFGTLETVPFLDDRWEKAQGEPLGGSGITRIVEEGSFFERGGVGFSHVTGQRLPPSASAARPELTGRSFEALGVSLVMHPRNPYVPTVHMNVRCFVARATHAVDIWWFGGGMDLTPYYGFEDDARHFHRSCESALSPFGAELYPRFKHNCDEYFYLKHRGETRGIGGIFFDDFSQLGFARSFALMKSVGDQFTQAYLPIARQRGATPYGGRERDWQSYRRARYVEFNLVFDRGTLFGLQSGGRTESILMSMPPQARWRYNYHPEAGSPEADLAASYLKPREWL
jgi:coproporphyrinogen III oxidase